MSWALILVVLSPFPGVASGPAPAPVRYIELHLSVNPAEHRIDGLARLTLSSRPGDASLALDLTDSLSVDSARVVGPASAGEIRGVRESNRIRFPVPGGAKGVQYQVAVWYHGTPARSAVGFGNAAGTRVASYGLPNSAKEWWPTIDDPSVKADSADIWITAPATLVAVSNGRQAGRAVSSDGRSATTHWTVRHPVYSDAVSFALGDYTVARSSASLTGGRRVPLEFYAFPEDSAKAATDFSAVPDILQFYEARLGPYPFRDEKYALVEMVRPSFREGQTLSHLGAPLLTGKRENEQVVAHEVAHQWFGNSLTVKSWTDIWLNESLSEYMAWQWIRKWRGDSAYRALLDEAAAAEATAPIVPANPADFSTLFGHATFHRGPVVLAMLEQQMGAPAFARALRSYVALHAYGSVETVDFQQACEQAYGKPLDGFFAQWVRGNAKLTKVP